MAMVNCNLNPAKTAMIVTTMVMIVTVTVVMIGLHSEGNSKLSPQPKNGSANGNDDNSDNSDNNNDQTGQLWQPRI